jgi:hypothetical protein
MRLSLDELRALALEADKALRCDVSYAETIFRAVHVQNAASPGFHARYGGASARMRAATSLPTTDAARARKAQRARELRAARTDEQKAVDRARDAARARARRARERGGA